MPPENFTPPALVHVPARGTPRLRLFCFPHAGSGAFPYRALAEGLPPWVDLSIVQLPGRETLFTAPLIERMEPLIAALPQVLAPFADRPFAFLGHSFGSVVAFELARALGGGGPRALVVSASRAPHLPLTRPTLHDKPNQKLLDELRRYGGTPEAVLRSQELMDLFLPTVRADLAVLETYRYAPGAPLDCPITALGARGDHSVSPEVIEAWRAHTSGAFKVQLFEGGHFYFTEPAARPHFFAALHEALSAIV